MGNLVFGRTIRLLYFILILFVLLGIRLFSLQLGASHPLSGFASNQYRTYIKLLPKRGGIYDSNGRELAVSVNLTSIFLDPLLIEDKEAVVGKLSDVLGIDKDKLIRKINSKKRFVWLARKLTSEMETAVRHLNIKGLGFVREPLRVYPNQMDASHIIGYVGMDDVGLEGLELRFNKFLKGRGGWRYTIRDAKRREVHGYKYKENAPIDGNDIVLTIDNVVQSIVERELDKAVEKYNAKGGSVIVMDPYKGDILALSNRPSYNPNEISKYPVDSRRNRAITDFFEPGSSFKIVTASAVLEENVVNIDDKFFCENGQFKWYNHIYHDHTSHGWLPFKDVLKYSSNIGTMKSAIKLGKNGLYRYIKRFGFGEKTRIDLPGEITGVVRPLNEWSKLSICSASMGQEVSVTAIQLVTALSCIANGGYYVRPRLVDRIQDKTGKVIKMFNVQKLHMVISNETANKMKEILRGVVEDGTGKFAEVKGYYPAGKTGTAQKIEPNGSYSHSKFTASFVGFLPYYNPVLTILVVLDEPRPIYYGGVTCAPVFKEIASQLMSYYRVETP